jgi:DNA/RNA-binding domain of Phe-tRNA-synthetase-like protein
MIEMTPMEYLEINQTLQNRYPNLAAQILLFKDISIKREDPILEEYKLQVINETKEKWKIDKLRNNTEFRAYRDFFWKLRIDPTKNRPSAEALIRRVLRDRPIPKINTWVDAYNLVSIITAIPIASFDADLIDGRLLMREAKLGEKFFGIGMKKPIELNGGEAVIQDNNQLVAIYPYRDADYSKVTNNTKNVLMLLCGAPGISKERLNTSAIDAKKILPRFCGGKVE